MIPHDLAQIFPMPDAPSARLMKLKAACLFRAGVITPSQRTAVVHQAGSILERMQSLRVRQACDSRAA
jgi:hypothetical protein